LVETDEETGIPTYQLTSGERPADNIYGEQPYSSPSGGRIAVRLYAGGGLDGGLSVLDLEAGILFPVQETAPRFPAFHAWGQYLFYQEQIGDTLLLRRCDYDTLVIEDVLVLPADGRGLSYGTISPDGRYYAVSVHRDAGSSALALFDLASGSERILAESADQWFKHEQFSIDGRNTIMIQANSADVTVVNIGVVSLDKSGVDWLPLDAPPLTPVGRWPGGARYTPRCTGHETWIGRTERVFLSTDYDTANSTNIWIARQSDSTPHVVHQSRHRFGHVSASLCGRYWIADATAETGIPIYVGSVATGDCRRAIVSRTEHDGKQWSHTHPYLTADNRWLVFTSNRSGIPQVYAAQIDSAFLASL
jgi:hypothetical protein